MDNTTWDILICTIEERQPLFDRLCDKLTGQISDNDLSNFVRILSVCDNRRITIGEKRNMLLEHSMADYTCFVDDDDDVSDNYVKLIYDAISLGKDCVSLIGEITFDGTDCKRFIHSIKYNKYFEANNTYFRPPNHLNPMKREIAITKKFPKINMSEDTDWAMQLCNSGALKTEVEIEQPYYFYRYITKK